MTTNRKAPAKILDERDRTKRLTMRKNVPVEDVNIMKELRSAIKAIKGDRDANAATASVFRHSVAGAIADADRSFYLVLIEMNRREIKLRDRLEAIEDRLDALEGRRLLS
jgi:hypothetical protein